MGNTEKIFGYLSARVHPDVQEYNSNICDALGDPISMLKPQDYYTPEQSPNPEEIVQRCIDDIQRSTFVLLLPEFGRDCGWEIGYATGRGMPVIAYIDTQTLWLTKRGDSMPSTSLYKPRRDAPHVGLQDSTRAMHSVTKIATTNAQTFEMLDKHPDVRKKLTLLTDIPELKKLILETCKMPS